VETPSKAVSKVKSEIENSTFEISMLFHKLFASVFGVGYLKGGGTVAAAICCVCWYFLWHGGYPPLLLSLTATLVITFAGVWSSSVMEAVWGKDPSKVVIDEVAGMCIGLLFLPVTIKYLLCAFILFRFFDIVKPLYIRKMELLPKGWGIMFDDVLAGAYTNILLQFVIWFKLF
jgi:phosphatidylglycerophosphatase A